MSSGYKVALDNWDSDLFRLIAKNNEDNIFCALLQLLKVSLFQKDFLVSTILTKNERKNSQNLEKSFSWFWRLLSKSMYVQCMGKIAQIFECFSESPNFTMILQVDLISFPFWKNLKTPKKSKDISKFEISTLHSYINIFKSNSMKVLTFFVVCTFTT